MEDKERKLLQASLVEAMERWLDEVAEKVSVPCYIGDNTTSLMADAAFAVLMGITDAQAYLEAEGMLKED